MRITASQDVMHRLQARHGEALEFVQKIVEDDNKLVSKQFHILPNEVLARKIPFKKKMPQLLAMTDEIVEALKSCGNEELKKMFEEQDIKAGIKNPPSHNTYQFATKGVPKLAGLVRGAWAHVVERSLVSQHLKDPAKLSLAEINEQRQKYGVRISKVSKEGGRIRIEKNVGNRQVSEEVAGAALVSSAAAEYARQARKLLNLLRHYLNPNYSGRSLYYSGGSEYKKYLTGVPGLKKRRK